MEDALKSSMNMLHEINQSVKPIENVIVLKDLISIPEIRKENCNQT
jgi:hypothetical protein